MPIVKAVNITFQVTVPSTTQKVYIIGNTSVLGDWSPTAAPLMTKVNTTTWKITLSLTNNTQYYYTFLCGRDWKYEKNPNPSTGFVTGTSDATQYYTVTAWTNTPPLVAPVTFNVTVPTSTQNVYLIGADELGNWETDKGRSLKMAKQLDGHFSLTVDLTSNKLYTYKYLCAPGSIYEMSPNTSLSIFSGSAGASTNDVVTQWTTAAPVQADIQNYLHRSSSNIVDGQGNNFISRAIGLGNYMVWEPYMWKVTDYTNAGTMQKIISRMSLLLNATDMQAFIDGYMANYMTKADVDSLKAWGFNAIRLPMHYNLFINSSASNNTFIEKGFTMTEQLRQWCAADGIYLILDLHAAPGGQGDDHAISDSDSPGLWDGNTSGTAAQYQEKTVVLWRELARRFGDKEYIGGYDILNETNYGGNNLKLLDLFKRCVNQIRLYDKKHIIYLEGNWFANDFSTIVPTAWETQWDDNMAYSCHKYWAAHDGFSGESLRSTYNVPLWLGETGENSNEWFYNNVKLAESRNLGWAWWSHKKIDNISGFMSITASASLEKIIKFVNTGVGMDATAKTANYAVFQDFLNYVKIENCKVNKDVIYSLIDQQASATATVPYGKNTVPGVIQANEYDLGRPGFAYVETNSDQVLQRLSNSDGAYNAGWTGRNDAVDFEKSSGTTDLKSNGYNIGWTNAGEWIQYSVNATTAGKYNVKIRSAGTSAATVNIKDGSNQLLLAKLVASTGGWQSWTVSSLGLIDLKKGWNKLRLAFPNGGINVSYLEFELIQATPVETETSEKLAVYVQNDQLMINSSRTITHSSIYNINGVEVMQTSDLTTPVSQLPRGAYIVTVTYTDGTNQQMKFIR